MRTCAPPLLQGREASFLALAALAFGAVVTCSDPVRLSQRGVCRDGNGRSLSASCSRPCRRVERARIGKKDRRDAFLHRAPLSKKIGVYSRRPHEGASARGGTSTRRLNGQAFIAARRTMRREAVSSAVWNKWRYTRHRSHRRTRFPRPSKPRFAAHHAFITILLAQPFPLFHRTARTGGGLQPLWWSLVARHLQ